MTASAHKTIDVQGLSVAYYDDGEGPLVLCLHGFPDHARSFRHQVPALVEAGYRVVVPYLRGYAPTGIPAETDYSVPALAHDALGLIDALGEKTAILIGHDWGAGATYNACVTAPEVVTKAVTMAVPFSAAFAAKFISHYPQLKRSWYMFFFQHPMAEMAVSANNYAFIENLWKDWSPGWDFPQDEMDALKATFAKKGVVSAALGYYRAAIGKGSGFGPAAQKISTPTLTFRGATDGCVGVDMFDGMEHSFSGPFELATVDGAGHFMHQEQPDAVNAQILAFLKS